MLNTQANSCETIRSQKRKYIAISLIILLLAGFWFLSRYPALINEYHRTTQNTLLERDASALTKDELMSTKTAPTNVTVAIKTTINWFDTNKVGMSFGILFATAILLLLEQSKFFYRRAAKPGFSGIFSGLLLGVPLGVCTNCATPVSLGMKEAGASHESAFTTLIASPSLNPIGLVIIFMLLPLNVAMFRLFIMLGFVLLILPLLIKLFTAKHSIAITEDSAEPADGYQLSENWRSAWSYSLKSYGKHFFYILKKVLPPMIIVGVIAALVVTYYPLEKLVLIQTDTLQTIILASVLGTILPIPMFVDIVLVGMLLSFGLPTSLAVVLIITLAPTSLYAMYVMGRNVSWAISVSVSVSICLLGIFAGAWVHYTQKPYAKVNYSATQQVIKTIDQFVPVKTLQLATTYQNRSLDNFFAGGISTIDYNNDGLVDIIVPAKQATVLLKNIDNGQFKDVTNEAGISKRFNSVAGIWGDYNNDGYPDLLLVNYKNANGKAQANRLYRNNGLGGFSDVTHMAGLGAKDFSSSAAWADYDNDGDLDLFVSNYGNLSIVDGTKIVGTSQQDKLYRNDNGRFVDVSKSAGVQGKQANNLKLSQIDSEELPADRGFSFQPVWFDYNNDNHIDLFVASDFGVSQLYKNNGDGSFSNVTEEAGLSRYGTGMGVAVFDYNQDGFFDLYVTNTAANYLWLNQGNGRFTEIANDLGIDDTNRMGWGVSPIDINNNGMQNLMIVNGRMLNSPVRRTVYEETLSTLYSANSFYVENTKKTYQEASRAYHLFNTAMGRGLAIADINNDGYLDMAMTNRDKNNMVVYQNQGGDQHSLQLQLQGTKSNRMAIGARVVVYVNDKVQHKLLTAGSSFLSQHSNVLHFGVGDATKIDKIVITWPGGKQQVLRDVPVKQKLVIKETI